MIVTVPDLALATFSGEIALTDSRVTNVVCNNSGITCLNGRGFLSSSFGDFHPTGTEYAIGEWGQLTFTGRTECDSIYLVCILRFAGGVIPTSIVNAYSIVGSNSQAYAGSRLYNFMDVANLFVDGQKCLYPGGTNGCGAFGYITGQVTNVMGDLYVGTPAGNQTYIGGNNVTQAIFNGTGIFPNKTQDFGGSGALWNNGYFNNIYYNNVVTPGLARERGKTCRIAGYVTLTIDGVRRKLAYCR